MKCNQGIIKQALRVLKFLDLSGNLAPPRKADFLLQHRELENNEHLHLY